MLIILISVHECKCCSSFAYDFNQMKKCNNFWEQCNGIPTPDPITIEMLNMKIHFPFDQHMQTSIRLNLTASILATMKPVIVRIVYNYFVFRMYYVKLSNFMFRNEKGLLTFLSDFCDK